MTAYDIYQSWMDSANTGSEEIRKRGDESEMLEDVIGYADGALGITLDVGIADMIVSAYQLYIKAVSGEMEPYFKTGDFANPHYYLVENVLDEIEIH